ncbi:unnamed protein product [Acanthoscelides obtectus]|uniref:DUF4371 domain-containing protein n=1 Tax=Acanthoscelides obtectus TaxID=200917 RepID=A0A9P0M7L5_ACAOB|nr:unnamed protein product [Acanthoscelides obtectus]CAK1626665.1 Zinc finger protein 862 [Acanthoscelides obtectus]
MHSARHATKILYVANPKSRNILQENNTQKTLTDIEKISLNNKMKTAEIQIAAYAAEHNISFDTLDHSSEIIKISFDDSEIAKNFTCSRTKATAIVNNVLGQYSFDNSINMLQTIKFSLIADESTDKGAIKDLVLVVRIFYEHKITDLFFDLLPVADATAEGLHNTIVNYFLKCNINFKENLIGFASDGASAMMGIHSSLSTKLKADIPNLFIMKCVCHSFSLCVNYACAKLTDDVEQMDRDVHTYLQYSFKFAEFQEFVAVKPHKIIQPSQTRCCRKNT